MNKQVANVADTINKLWYVNNVNNEGEEQAEAE